MDSVGVVGRHRTFQSTDILFLPECTALAIGLDVPPLLARADEVCRECRV
jgi:hypothetical protein